MVRPKINPYDSPAYTKIALALGENAAKAAGGYIFQNLSLKDSWKFAINEKEIHRRIISGLNWDKSKTNNKISQSALNQLIKKSVEHELILTESEHKHQYNKQYYMLNWKKFCDLLIEKVYSEVNILGEQYLVNLSDDHPYYRKSLKKIYEQAKKSKKPSDPAEMVYVYAIIMAMFDEAAKQPYYWSKSLNEIMEGIISAIGGPVGNLPQVVKPEELFLHPVKNDIELNMDEKMRRLGLFHFIKTIEELLNLRSSVLLLSSTSNSILKTIINHRN